MKLLSLRSIRIKTKNLAKVINAAKDLLPTFGNSRDFDYPHIEVDKKGYHYVIIERGKEYERNTTQDLEELLYWIFKDITFQMASDYELNSRVPNQDSRRLLFAKQLELMKTINPAFCKELDKEQNEILKEHPFNDNRE